MTDPAQRAESVKIDLLEEEYNDESVSGEVKQLYEDIKQKTFTEFKCSNCDFVRSTSGL